MTESAWTFSLNRFLKPAVLVSVLGAAFGVGLLVSTSMTWASVLIVTLLLLSTMIMHKKFRPIIVLLAIAVVVGPLARLDLLGSSRSLQIYALDLVVLFLIATTIGQLLQDRKSNKPQLYALLVTLVMVSIPSLLFTEYLSRSIGILRYTWVGFLVYVLLRQWQVSEADLRFSRRILLAGGLLLGSVYVGHTLLPNAFVVGEGVRSITIFFGASINYVSVLFLPFIFLSLSTAAAETDTKWRVVGFLSVAFFSILLVTSVSRSSIIGLVVGLGIYYWQRLKFERVRFTQLGKILLLLSGLAVLFMFVAQNPYFQERYQQTMGLLRIQSWDALLRTDSSVMLDSGDWLRAQVWNQYIAAIPKNLWFGAGLAGLPHPFVSGALMEAHNWVLEFMYGIGLFGTLFYVYLILWTWKQSQPDVQSGQQYWLAIAARSSVGAALAAAFFQPLLSSGYQFIVLIWLMLALATMHRQDQGTYSDVH